LAQFFGFILFGRLVHFEQKLDYAKLMVNKNYSNKKIIAISGAGPSAVTRWKKQYLATSMAVCLMNLIMALVLSLSDLSLT
jgi:hypothetical protein